MKKNILNEINRNREIMGLGNLIIKEFVEETTGQVLSEQDDMTNWDVEKWVPAVLQQNSPNFWKFLKAHNFDDEKYGTSQVTFTKAIAYAYKLIYGEDLTLDSLHVFQDGFLKGRKLSNSMSRGDGPKMGGIDHMVLSNAPGSSEYKVTLTFAPLGWEQDEIDLDEALMKMNEFNILNAGTLQIHKIATELIRGKSSRFKSGTSNYSYAYSPKNKINKLKTKPSSHALILFSAAKEKTTIQSGQGGTIKIAGDVVSIPGDQLFADVAVVPNKNVVKDAIDQLVAQAQGKKVKTIKVHSSASNDTIKNPETFKTNLQQYKGWTDAVIQAVDTEAQFTEQDLKSNPTGNRALAYMRGQKVAELLKNVELLKGADIQFVYEVGGSGDKHQFANLEIIAMEDDAIEVLKSGTVSKTTTKIGRARRTTQTSANDTTESFSDNIIDMFKANITFDDSKVTKSVAMTRKKKIWPPSEWFKSKSERTTTSTKEKKTLTNKQNTEKDLYKSPRTL